MIKEARIASVVSLYPVPQYVVVLEDLEKTRLVPIWIGASEGNAISIELRGEKFPRPLTHDLIVLMLQELGAAVEKIVINDLRDNSYFALIHLRHQGQTLILDARPSDSLALAVRVKCPIFIEEKVLKLCPPIEGNITPDEIEKFKEELKTMSPEEFFKKLEEAPLPTEEEVSPEDEDISDEDEEEEGGGP